MSAIKIVTDSSVQLTPEEIKEYDITVIPLSVMIDDTIYEDGITLSRTEFMTLMKDAKALPKTSQPAIGEFVDCFNEFGKNDSQVLAIHMTETISGTVNSARQAAQIAKADVTVIDSDFTDRGMAFQVIAAAQMAKSGVEMKDILTRIKTIHDNTKLYMAVTTLDNMVKGGRMSRVTGIISSMLNIKVILELKDAKLDVMTKGRGMKTINKFVESILEQVRKLPNIREIGISHADALDEANEIRNQLVAINPDIPILVAPTSPIIATHTGAGAFAIMFYTEPSA